MTQFLPPNLLALFAPRDPIPYLQPPDKLPHEKKNVHNYHGMAMFVANNFENPADTPPPTKVEMREERIERKRREKEEQETYKLEQKMLCGIPNLTPKEQQTLSEPYPYHELISTQASQSSNVNSKHMDRSNRSKLSQIRKLESHGVIAL